MAFIELTEESGRKIIVNTDHINEIISGKENSEDKPLPTEIRVAGRTVKITETYKTMRHIIMASNAVFYDQKGIVMKDQAMSEMEFKEANPLPDILKEKLSAAIAKNDSFDIKDPLKKAACDGFAIAMKTVLKTIEEYENGTTVKN